MSSVHPFVLALIGGAMIGLAAGLLWLASGRIAGVSGVIGGLVGAPAGDRGWRLALIVGLIAGGVIARGIDPTWVAAGVVRPTWLLVPAGLLVGFGARLGGGCTSGHGVCGMARLSRRSIVATVVFMAVAVGTTTLARGYLGGLR